MAPKERHRGTPRSNAVPVYTLMKRDCAILNGRLASWLCEAASEKLVVLQTCREVSASKAPTNICGNTLPNATCRDRVHAIRTRSPGQF